MDLICGRTIEIHFIPTLPYDAILAHAKNLKVRQINDATFGPDSIDAAILKILSHSIAVGAPARGIKRITESAREQHVNPASVVTLHLPIGLANFSNEFGEYATHYYEVDVGTPLQEAIIQTICQGELDLEDQVFIDSTEIKARSRHEEIARRAEIAKAYKAYLASAVAA